MRPKPYQLLFWAPTYHWNGRPSSWPMTLTSGSAPFGVKSTRTSYSAGGSNGSVIAARPLPSESSSPSRIRHVPEMASTSGAVLASRSSGAFFGGGGGGGGGCSTTFGGGGGGGTGRGAG